MNKSPGLPVLPSFTDSDEHESRRDSSTHPAPSEPALEHPYPSGPRGRFRRAASTLRKLATLPPSILRARRGETQLPRVMTHTVTFGCNAKCVMCDSWQLPTSGDLTLDEIRNIYGQLPPMDVVRLTGGEPFVRRDFPQIFQSALDALQPLWMHVSSNGFLTERIVNFCQQRDTSVPLELAISIDGVGDYHNRIRGHTMAWQTAWKTLNQLAPLRKRLQLSLTVNQTVADNQGLEEYERLHEYLQPLEIEHHVIVAYAESATYSLERDRKIENDANFYPTFAELDRTQLEDMLRLAEQHARHLPLHRRLPRLYYLRGLKRRLPGGATRRPPVCQALHTHLRLFPNGDVPVCQFNSQIVGNLQKQAFHEVWMSVMAAEQRQWVRNCAGCWAECEVAPSAIYTLDVLRDGFKS